MKWFKFITLALLLPALLTLFSAPACAYPDKAGREHPLSRQIKPAQPADQTDDYPQMPGWPNSMGVMGMFAPQEGPIQVDIDGDGDLEIFAASTDNYLYGWHHDGTNVAGFPIMLSGPNQSSPAAGDIDGDGDLEILVGSRSGYVHAFHHNGTPVTGWPQLTYDEIAINSVALWDFDNDGSLEVFVGSDRLYIWDGDGTSWPGFPVNFSGAQYGTCSSSSVGDIDGDGDPEIILEGWDYLNAFHLDGSVVAGWPYALSGAHGFSYSAPSLVDINADGDVEIFCASHESGGSYNSLLYGLDGDGTDLPGFPQFIQGWTYSTPSIGDLDNDGDVEIALLCNSALLYAFKTDGSPAPGFPVYFGSFNCEAPTVMVDIDNDGQLDLLFGNNGGTAGYRYYGYRGDGTPHPDFPFITDGATFPNCSAVADADGDGDLEIAHYVGSGTVNLWDAPYPAAGASLPWPVAHHDVQHTGNYHFGAEAYDVTITMELIEPWWPPSFDFDVTLTNNESSAVNFDAWIMVQLPNGSWYGPLLGPVNITLPAGGSITRTRTQVIPAGIPAGDYWFEGRVGDYPSAVWDTSGFTISIVPYDAGSAVNEWLNTGESFLGEETATKAKIPESFAVSAHPNPFNPTTTIRFQLPLAGFVTLEIFDVNGRAVGARHAVPLQNAWHPPGTHEVTFNASNLPSGIYFARLTTGDFQQTKKMVLVK